MNKSILSLLLLVSLASGDLIRDNILNVVIDTSTKLMWQDNNETNITTKTWAEANIYCEDLNLSSKINWRLPNQKELLTIGDKTINTPAIYKEFIYTKTTRYWSSSTQKSSGSKAWFVNFDDASSWLEPKDTEYDVRCVRVVD
jgi:hypothetical protein